MPREDLAVRAGLRDLVPVGVPACPDSFADCGEPALARHRHREQGTCAAAGRQKGRRRRSAGFASSPKRARLLGANRGDARVSYSLGLQVGETAAAAAVARGPHIDVHVLPVEPNLGGVGTARARSDPSAHAVARRHTIPPRRRSSARAASGAGPGALAESIMRAAFAAVVPSQPDELVSIALAHPTAWTVEQVDAAAAAAAATAPPAVLTQLVPAAVAVAADYCTIAMLGDGDAVLVCDLFESTFEVTAVGRDGDRLVLLGEQTETPSVGVGVVGLGPAPEQRGSLSGGGGEGEHDGSGLWASDLAGAVRRALQTAHLHRAVVVDVVLSGPAARQRWLQQAAAEASGFDGVQVLPYSASRGAAQMAVVAAPPAAGGSPSSPEVGRHTADAERVPFGHTTGGAAPAAAAGDRDPGPGPLSASGGPWLPPTAAPPPRRRPRPGGGRAGSGGDRRRRRAGPVLRRAVRAVVDRAEQRRTRARQSPPVVVVEPSPSSSEADGLVDGGLRVDAAQRGAECVPGSPRRRSRRALTSRRFLPRCRSGRRRVSRQRLRPELRPASSSMWPTGLPGC